MDLWTPVSPRLTPGGAFEAFAHWPNPDRAKPLPCPPDGEPWGFRESTPKNLHITAAFRLGLAGFVDIAAALETRTLVYDFALFKEATFRVGHDPRIRATRWGHGLRLTLNVWSFDGTFDLSLPAIAAAVELGYANVSYEITGFGIGSKAILAKLPSPTRFDNDAYEEIVTATDAIRNLSTSERGEPVPFAVILAVDAAGAPLDIARSVHYAAEAIYRKKSLADARAGRPGWVDLPTLERTYAALLGDNHTRVPTTDDYHRARAWLRHGEI